MNRNRNRSGNRTAWAVAIMALAASMCARAADEQPVRPSAPQPGPGHFVPHAPPMEMHGLLAGQWLEHHFDAVDANHDGQISKEELAAFVRNNRGQMRARFEARFRRADRNHDGALSREEAKGMPMIARHFDEMDANHDGKVTLAEVEAFFKAHRKPHAGMGGHPGGMQGMDREGSPGQRPPADEERRSLEEQ